MVSSDFMILGLGSNLGDRQQNLTQALDLLKEHFTWQGRSKIYSSAAVDYVDQPPFYNLVAQFALPPTSPQGALQTCLALENQLGRQRIISRGPRNIDIDLLFWSIQQINTPFTTHFPATIVPHPRLWQRSFVFFLLQELPAASILQQAFPQEWDKAERELKSSDLQLVE